MLRGVAALSVLLCVSPAVAERPAPALSISRWLRGDPVKELAADKTYLVTFWATWSDPGGTSFVSLARAARRFGPKGSAFPCINVDGPETSDAVEPYLKSLGEMPGLVFGLDDQGKTREAYLEEFEATGLPYSFIVQKGAVVWHGKVTDDIDFALAKLVGDEEYVKLRQKVKTAHSWFEEACSQNNFGDAYFFSERLLRLDPEDDRHLEAMFPLLLQSEYVGYPAVQKWAARVSEKVHRPSVLNEWAWTFLTNERVGDELDPRAALAIARRANDLTHGKDPMILDTHALALFRAGSLSEATTAQRTAVDMAEAAGLEQDMLKDMKSRLQSFEKALKAKGPVEKAER